MHIPYSINDNTFLGQIAHVSSFSPAIDTADGPLVGCRRATVAVTLGWAAALGGAARAHLALGAMQALVAQARVHGLRHCRGCGGDGEC